MRFVRSALPEYNYIYRFVVREQNIRFMDESCGYIEHTDDDGDFRVRGSTFPDVDLAGSSPRRRGPHAGMMAMERAPSSGRTMTADNTNDGIMSYKAPSPAKKSLIDDDDIDDGIAATPSSDLSDRGYLDANVTPVLSNRSSFEGDTSSRRQSSTRLALSSDGTLLNEAIME